MSEPIKNRWPEQKARVNKLRAAKARAARRRRNLIVSGVACLAVVAVVAALVIIKAVAPTAAKSAPAATAAQFDGMGDGVLPQLAAIPAATLAPAATKAAAPTAIKGPALTADGKPEVFYLGAEYCPYCAAQNWALVIALSHFGTFTNLRVTHSATDDAYSGTPTFSFHGATYTSSYLSFTGVETATNQRQGTSYAPLDRPNADQQALVTANDASGSIPFVDLGGRAVISGSSYNPAVLTGASFANIATAVADPSSRIGPSVQAAAGMIAGQLCQLTGNQPPAVCGAFSGGVGSAR